jgi:hypothetical protein
MIPSVSSFLSTSALAIVLSLCPSISEGKAKSKPRVSATVSKVA